MSTTTTCEGTWTTPVPFTTPGEWRPFVTYDTTAQRCTGCDDVLVIARDETVYGTRTAHYVVANASDFGGLATVAAFGVANMEASNLI